MHNQATKLSDSVFRMIFEKGPSDYLVLTPTFHIAAASDSMLNTIKRDWSEIAGQVVFDAFPDNPDDLEADGTIRLRRSLEAVIATRMADTMPFRRYDILDPGGNGTYVPRFWCSSNTPILDHAGNVQMILHRTEDVTDSINFRNSKEDMEVVAKQLRKRIVSMEESRVGQEDKAALLAQEALLLAKEVIRDRATNLAKDIQMENRAQEVQAELAREEAKAVLLADEALILAKEKIDDRATNLAKDLQMQGRAQEMEAELSRHEIKAMALAKEKVLDRASTKLREHRLHEEAEEKFKSLLEVSPDSMVIIDRSSTILLVNAQAEQLFSYGREELLGQTVDFLLPAGYRMENGENAAKFFAASQNQVAGLVIELEGCRKDHSEFPFDVTIRPLSTPDGMLTVLAIRDLTERRRASAQVVRAQRMESIGTFAGNIAHDLNNALAPVLMALELLRKQNPNAPELINTIESGANRGADMLRQLLVFSKGAYIEPRHIQTAKMLGEIQELIKTTFPKNIQFRSSVAEGLLPIMGDPTQIHQVLVNLCVNARDAMPEGGVLTLQADNVEIDESYACDIPGAKPGPYVMWRISDTGVGITSEVLDRIFEPFFTTKALGKGTGLGLSIVVGIVKSHHGFVNAYSKPLKGSTFSVYIPADTSGIDEADAPVKVLNSFRGNGEAILVVDDSEGMRGAAKTVLDALNVHIITAIDGQDALEIVAKFGHTLSAVITDVHMPNMDGLAFVRELRAHLPEIGIIVISGNLDEDEAKGFAELGVHTFLDKPFTQDKLTMALSQVLAS